MDKRKEDISMSCMLETMKKLSGSAKEAAEQAKEMKEKYRRLMKERCHEKY